VFRTGSGPEHWWVVMVAKPDPAEEFAAELRQLYQAAGAPTYAVLVRQATQQKSDHLRLTEQSLSDWLRGKAVPDKPAAVRFLVAYLEPLAGRNGYPRRGGNWWAVLHAKAQDVKRANRGGRPSRRGTKDALPHNGGSVPAFDPSVAHAAETLESALASPSDFARRTTLDRLLAELEDVHRDYLLMFESILEQVPDPWQCGTSRFMREVAVAAANLRQLRLQYEPVRVRIQAAADALSRTDLPTSEKVFVAAVIAYFPTGELRSWDAEHDVATSGTAVLNHLYRALDGELGPDLGALVRETLTFHRQRWRQVCETHAGMQLDAGRLRQ
jgi:hypothetical protein